jgi:hypothetical protein
LAAWLLATAVLPVAGAEASCAAPYLQVGEFEQRPVLEAGSSVTVEGRAFVDGCNDSGGVAVVGCIAIPEEETDTEAAMSDVTLSLRQGPRRYDLGTEDAGLAEDNELGQITWEITLPGNLRRGPAMLMAGTARLQIDIRR